jgi:hypothetical protein
MTTKQSQSAGAAAGDNSGQSSQSEGSQSESGSDDDDEETGQGEKRARKANRRKLAKKTKGHKQMNRGKPDDANSDRDSQDSALQGTSSSQSDSLDGESDEDLVPNVIANRNRRQGLTKGNMMQHMMKLTGRRTTFLSQN